MHTTPLVGLVLVAGCASNASTERDAPGPDAVLADATPSRESASLEAPFPEGTQQIVHRLSEIAWGPCPPGPLADLGCQLAVLEGSPKAEQLFTIRFKASEPFVLPPHTHPGNERATVLEGAVHVGFGDVVDKADSTRFEPGDYYVNRAGAHHFVWSDEPVVLQLTGIGPWAIQPLEGQGSE
jgi:quercetin dioxygenase-like cupin family protein